MDSFHTTTARWGQATMLAGLAFSLLAPAYFMFGLGHWPGWEPVLQAWLSVAAVFGVLWVAEPITYYPMLGQAATYQAFMIGNIANKLLPSALAAQTAIGARQGTPRAELAAVVAIVGATAVHLVSLAVFVGLLGGWLVSVIPAGIQQAFDYVVPAIFGPVLVQAVLGALHQRRTVPIALLCGILGVYGLVGAIPSASSYAMAVSTIAAVVLSVLLREKTRDPDSARADEVRA
ncbi:hypothetical protein IQ251_12560 [Saccharopolyspora sp. HNM0983]|uniref:Uncharacterized protein n=1 Tax=Saccharopolyspora montiporae TaxID=2781240 RepID=A0A929FY22_9PSEU|nr:hypothetical protein [Saccharopolyspora sp. HNM0983]MBE9375276.1 hypothetical protein [Saccharopolyspora sp. HNM0983]